MTRFRFAAHRSDWSGLSLSVVNAGDNHQYDQYSSRNLLVFFCPRAAQVDKIGKFAGADIAPALKCMRNLDPAHRPDSAHITREKRKEDLPAAPALDGRVQPVLSKKR